MVDYLANVYVNQDKRRINISEWLLEKRLAISYDGKKKKNIDWFSYYNKSI